MENKEHWTENGFKRLVLIAHSMNGQGKQRKYSIKDIFSKIDSNKLIVDTAKNPQRPTSDPPKIDI
jgi:hypothetical protein